MEIKKNKKELGQSLVELVFSLGIVALVLTGVIILVTNILGARTRALDRKKASELALLVMEDLVNRAKNSPESFWTLTDETDRENINFPGFVYSVDYSNVVFDYTGSSTCGFDSEGIGVTNCAEAVINVGWSGKTPESVTFNRFFFKQ